MSESEEPRNTVYVATSEAMKPILAAVLAEVARLDSAKYEYWHPKFCTARVYRAAVAIRDEVKRLRTEGA